MVKSMRAKSRKPMPRYAAIWGAHFVEQQEQDVEKTISHVGLFCVAYSIIATKILR